MTGMKVLKISDNQFVYETDIFAESYQVLSLCQIS